MNAPHKEALLKALEQIIEVAEAIVRDVVAGRQETEVLAAFQAAAEDADEDDFDAARLTPSQVHAFMKRRDWRSTPLLTSVRRAITNLAKRGVLTHHEHDRRPGPFGAKESTWSLRA